MKRKYIFCCVLLVFCVIVLMLGCFKLLKPVGNVGDVKIRSYELFKQAQIHRQQLFEELADEIAFEILIEDLGISVTEDEIKVQMAAVEERFPELNNEEVYAICMKSILHQKAVEKFASEVFVDAELARKYYDENRTIYGEGEPDYEQIKNDMQMEIGERKYEEYLNKIKREHEYSFYG